MHTTKIVTVIIIVHHNFHFLSIRLQFSIHSIPSYLKFIAFVDSVPQHIISDHAYHTKVV